MSHFQHINYGFLLLILLKSASTDLLGSMVELKERIERLGEEQLFKVFNENNIKEKYMNAYKAQMYTLMPVNEMKIVERFSQQLELELRKKMEALKNTVEFAENHAKEYEWDDNITIANVSYINSKKLLESDSRLVDNPLFKTKVIMDQSSVHIPTEIYDEDNTILNTIKWTSRLNQAFINYKDVLRYQYFTSYTGIVMQYPGMVWRNKDVDMYDVRRRPWFVQGASSPKDIMILIDTSGSMHGISITLTKIAVQKLIDTMGENDYIAVAQFPGMKSPTERANVKSNPHLLKDSDSVPCFNTFVQASKRNKDRLFAQINQLKANGIALLEEALEFGIRQFHAFDNARSRDLEGANCNRIILVLTDGGDDYDRQKIKSISNESKLTENIRIFIYSIGEDIAPTDAMKGITCDFRGFFGHIRAIGAVNNIIDKFVTVVHTHKIHERNPLGDNELRVIVSNVVEDEFLNPHDFPPKGLGLMTSLTMPVYNRSGNGTFLGLLGTDMTVDFMNHLVPRNKLGPNGYAFAINTNGYIIFHPELKVQRGWMRDPPNVDLIEVEFESEDKIKIRKSIINSAASNGTMKGNMDVKSIIKVVDEIHTYEKVRNYAYHGVPLSTFGVAIVNPKFNKYYPDFSTKLKFNKLESCNNQLCSMSVILPSGVTQNITFYNSVYIYAEKGLLSQCKIIEEEIIQDVSSSTNVFSTSTPFIQKSTSQLLPISTFGSSISESLALLENITRSSSTIDQLENSSNLSISTINSIFSEEFIKLLKFSENKSTNKCPEYENRRLVVDLIILESLVNSLDITALGKSIKSIVVAMISGITLIYPESEKHVYKNLFDSSSNSPIFQRTFDMEKLIFYTPLHRRHPSTNLNEPFSHNDVIIFKAFSADHMSNQLIPAAVLGITIQQSAVIDILGSYKICKDFRICYLLEDGGYIVSVSDPNYVNEIGYFFGEIHVEIMKNLINHSVFLVTEEFDFQASCPRPSENDTTSASNRLVEIITSLPIKVIQILMNYMESLISLVKFAIHLLFIHLSHSQETTASNNENVSCITKSYRYYLPENGNLDKPTEIFQSCNNCNFTILSQRFRTSNLVLLTFDKNCSKICQQMKVESPIFTTPIRDPGPNLCALSLKPNFRLRPKYKCYEFDPSEDFTQCFSPKLHVSQLSTLITLIILFKCL